MKKTILTLALSFLGLSSTFAQVGTGTTNSDASAILELDSQDKGFLPPRMETAERSTSLAPGLIIYNLTLNCLEFYNDGTAASKTRIK